MDEHEIREKLEKYVFYHLIRVTDSIETKGLADTLLTLGLRVECVELQHTGRVFGIQISNGATVGVRHPGLDPRHKEKVIDRVAMLCRAAPELRKEKLTPYWEGTHQMHSVRGMAD